MNELDPYLSSALLIIFLLGIFGLCLLSRDSVGNRNLTKARQAKVDLNTFVRNGPGKKNSKHNYLFSEENVVSMTYGYNGRFDHAVARWDTGPILVAVIERKFPRSVLPDALKQEDMFQLSLYTLALKEKGFSCSSTKLVTIYCLQDEAIECLKKQSGLDCLHCEKGKSFNSKFNEKKTLKHLARLDEVWNQERKPKPNPSLENCRACPFTKNKKCEFSVV
ncbi:MAG: hypothetical protein P1Q69_14025 [Candidatus Thorarchaeota archaeon]|nr:hypothetical protein [Candidatus Thorarchaeota archaeon]